MALRGLALTCLVLLALSVAALTQVDHPNHRRQAVSARFAPGDASPAVRPGDTSPTLVELFPATTSSTTGKTTTTRAGTAHTTTTLSNGPPATTTLVYAVDGTEAGSGYPSRKLPPTMILDVARPAGTSSDEVTLDARFSPQHDEHVVLKFGADGVVLRSEKRRAVFAGAGDRGTDARFDPSIAVVVAPWRANAASSGVSDARDSGGSVIWEEDWRAVDGARATFTVGKRSVDTWRITITRTTRAGTANQFQETRDYWYDPVARVFVKWQEHLHATRSQTLSDVSYDLNFTATLT